MFQYERLRQILLAPIGCTEDRSGCPSGLINDSDRTLDDAAIIAAIEDFTDTTGIPLILVIRDAEEVFG